VGERGRVVRAASDPARDRRRERTLALAVALSAWAPFATAIAVVLAPSTTQVADFVRRTVELVAMALAWATARHLRRHPDVAPAVAARWARSTAIAAAIALAVSGAATAVGLVVGARWAPGGDVRLGLAVATLGLLVNAAFWVRYRALGRGRADPIVDGQRRLYRAKVVVDAAVVAALATPRWAPAGLWTTLVDRAGAAAVAAYLLASAWNAWRAALAPPRTGSQT
jgi:hypothetical protein